MKSEAELNVMSTNLSVEVTLLRLVGAGRLWVLEVFMANASET